MASYSSCTCLLEPVARWAAHRCGWNIGVACESGGTKARRCPPYSRRWAAVGEPAVGRVCCDVVGAVEVMLLGDLVSAGWECDSDGCGP